MARLGCARLRQAGEISEVALSRDGRTLASCTTGDTVCVWESSTGKQRARFTRPGEPLRKIALSPDGKRLAVAGTDGSVSPIYLWDVDAGRILGVQKVIANPVKALLFSPDGRYVAIGGYWGLLSLWDTKGQQVCALQDHRQAEFLEVMALAFSPQGDLLASGGGGEPFPGNTAIRLWDVATGKEVGRLAGHSEKVCSLCFSSDGRRVAATAWRAAREMWIWDVKDRRVVRKIDRPAMAVAYSPDGRYLAASDPHGAVVLLDPETGSMVSQIGGNSVPYVRSMAFSGDGKLLATAGSSNTIGLWDVATGKAWLPLPGHNYGVVSVTFSPDGKTLVSGGGRMARFWDVASGQEIYHLDSTTRECPIEAGVHGVAFSPDGKLLAMRGNYYRPREGWVESVQVWDVNGRKKLLGLKGPGGKDFAFSPDGKTLITSPGIGVYSVGNGDTVRVLDPNPKPGKTLYTSLCAALSPDGRTVAAGYDFGPIRFWDWTTGQVVHMLKTDMPRVTRVAYSADGKVLAAVGYTVDREGMHWSARTWDAATYSPVHKFEGHQGEVAAVALSPDGRLLATAGKADKTVRVWHVFTGKELAKLEGHDGGVLSLAFSPDGKLLASGSEDTTILLWDVGRIDARFPATKLDPKEAPRLWEDLASRDGPAACRAVAVLAGAGDEAAVWLRERVKPVPVPDSKRLQALLAALDAEDFATRRKAQEELEALGDVAAPALRQALAGDLSAEARRRINAVLARVQSGHDHPDRLRQLRAVQVLELLGTSEACRTLEALAKGAPGAALTVDASTALQRLKRRGVLP